MGFLTKPTCTQILCVMILWGQIQNYMMRINLSIAIVAMIGENSTNTTHEDIYETISEDTPSSNLSTTQSPTEYNKTHTGDIDWSPSLKGIVLSSFGYGYATTQIIGGRMAEKIGAKKIFGGGLLLTGLVTFLLPVAAKTSVYLFIFFRVLQGIFEGVTWPSLIALTARWIPPLERSSFMARSVFGTVLGTLITFPLCGSVISSFGWESSFYVVGSITTIWFFFWCYFVYDSPDSHPRISAEEKNSIIQSLSKTVDYKRSFPVPWRSIWTSLPFIGLLFSGIGNAWGLSTLINYTPTYMQKVQGVDLKTNGLISSLPFGARWIGAILCSFIADIMLKGPVISTTNVRRIFSIFAFIGPAIALCMVAFAPDSLQGSITYITIVLCVGTFFNGAICACVLCTYIEIAPNFAGTLLGIGNTSDSIVTFIAPIVIGQVLDNRSLSVTQQWQVIFMVPSALYILSTITYLITVTGNVQHWNSKHRNYTISINSLPPTPVVKKKIGPKQWSKEAQQGSANVTPRTANEKVTEF